MSEAMIKHHLDSFGKRDVDEILEDYCEDAVIIVPGKVISGETEIRSFFEHLTTNVLPPASDFDLLENIVVDDIAYITWSAETEHITITFASDTFVFDENDKIRAQTIAFSIMDKI